MSPPLLGPLFFATNQRELKQEQPVDLFGLSSPQRTFAPITLLLKSLELAHKVSNHNGLLERGTSLRQTKARAMVELEQDFAFFDIESLNLLQMRTT